MTPSTPFRDAAARRDAIRTYRLAADRLGDEEQMHPHDDELHDYALIALTALIAEVDDPLPMNTGLRVCCLECAAYLAAPSVMKLVPLEEAML